MLAENYIALRRGIQFEKTTCLSIVHDITLASDMSSPFRSV